MVSEESIDRCLYYFIAIYRSSHDHTMSIDCDTIIASSLKVSKTVIERFYRLGLENQVNFFSLQRFYSNCLFRTN